MYINTFFLLKGMASATKLLSLCLMAIVSTLGIIVEAGHSHYAALEPLLAVGLLSMLLKDKGKGHKGHGYTGRAQSFEENRQLHEPAVQNFKNIQPNHRQNHRGQGFPISNFGPPGASPGLSSFNSGFGSGNGGYGIGSSGFNSGTGSLSGLSAGFGTGSTGVGTGGLSTGSPDFGIGSPGSSISNFGTGAQEYEKNYGGGSRYELQHLPYGEKKTNEDDDYSSRTKVTQSFYDIRPHDEDSRYD